MWFEDRDAVRAFAGAEYQSAFLCQPPEVAIVPGNGSNRQDFAGRGIDAMPASLAPIQLPLPDRRPHRLDDRLDLPFGEIGMQGQAQHLIGQALRDP